MFGRIKQGLSWLIVLCVFFSCLLPSDAKPALEGEAAAAMPETEGMQGPEPVTEDETAAAVSEDLREPEPAFEREDNGDVSGAESAMEDKAAAALPKNEEVQEQEPVPETNEDNPRQKAAKVQEPELTFEWEDDFVIPNVEGTQAARSGLLAIRAAALPLRYDSRQAGVVTSVRDQSPYEVCWAIAAAEMAESSLLTKGISLDLSERHLAWFMFHSVTDPLGNTAGDKTEALGKNYLWRGGHPIFTTFALANWVGMAEEDTAPWQEILDKDEEGTELPDVLAYQDAAHMQNAYWINTVNMNHIKKAIMDYGGVIIPINYKYMNYNEEFFSYYNHDKNNTSDNHSVFIIGWDDTFSKDNFNKTPDGDGAFLVKNSYGEDWGDGGYFWISYQDVAITKETGAVYVYDFKTADQYDNNYQYDGTAGRYIGPDGLYNNKIPSGGSIANVFEVSDTAGTYTQVLKAVSFSTLNANLSYSIRIYKNPTDSSNPESGEAQLIEPQLGTTLYTGYYTIPLDTEILLERGDTFAVVITLTSSDGEDITYCADYSYQNGDWIRFTSATGPNQSFVKNGSWQDLHTYGAAARVKAFTCNVYEYYTIAVSVKNGVGGRVIGGGQVRKGESVILTAIPDDGYEFVNWTEQEEIIGSEPELVLEEVHGDREIQANFRLRQEIYKEPEKTPEEESGEGGKEPEQPSEAVKSPKQAETVTTAGSSVQTGDHSNTEHFLLLFLGSGLVIVQILRIRWKEHG